MKFTRKDSLKKHQKRFHSHLPVVHQCLVCHLVFRNYGSLERHRESHASEDFFEVENALSATTYRYVEKVSHTDIKKLQSETSTKIMDLINIQLNRCQNIKVGLVALLELAQTGLDGEIVDIVEHHFRAKNFMSSRYDDHRMNVHLAFEEIRDRVDMYQENGSNWVVWRIVALDVQMSECKPLNGSCGRLSVKYAKDLKTKGIPRKAERNDCFYQAVAAFFVGEKERDIDKFIKRHLVKISNQTDVVNVKDVGKFENLNPQLDAKIHIVMEENEKIFPVRVSPKKTTHTIILALVKVRVGNAIVDHFFFVPDLGKVIRKKYSSLNEEGQSTTSYQNLYHSVNCFTSFSSQRVLGEHFENCRENDPQKIVFPYDEDVIEFKNFNNKFKVPFTGFLDFEASSKKNRNLNVITAWVKNAFTKLRSIGYKNR